MTSEQKGLRLAAGITMAFGLTTALAAYPPTAGFTVMLTDLLVWPMDGAETGGSAEARLLYAIAGGVLVGWGWLIWQLAGDAIVRNPDGIRMLIRQSVMAWFAVDGIASLLAGAPLNLVGNLVFLALFLIPTALPGRSVSAS
ncbi:MAG: hypothetical protein HC844_16445 [Tabrizicola sp.]|nr:hypothetical protein [Tabrizicola sp.]